MPLQHVPIHDVHYLSLGRHGDLRNDLGYPLFWTGSGVGLDYDGAELWLEIEASYNEYEPWISVDVDGTQVSRLALDRGSNDVCLFRGLDTGTIKHVRVLKETQFMHEDPSQTCIVRGLRCDDGQFHPLTSPTLRLEFVGDSITSGEGLEGARTTEHYCSMIFGARHGYPCLVADEMNADFCVISQAGWGIVCDCENNPHCTIPSIYERVCAPARGKTNAELQSDAPYRFDDWPADAVIINLGTNDAAAFLWHQWTDPSTGEQFELRTGKDHEPLPEDLEFIETAVNRFLRTVRKRNPHAVILWCYGMLGNRLEPILRRAVEHHATSTGDGLVRYVPLPACSTDDLGACQHPGRVCHQSAAAILVRILREMLHR